MFSFGSEVDLDTSNILLMNVTVRPSKSNIFEKTAAF